MTGNGLKNPERNFLPKKKKSRFLTLKKTNANDASTDSTGTYSLHSSMDKNIPVVF